jgi:hypothetical protein
MHMAGGKITNNQPPPLQMLPRDMVLSHVPEAAAALHQVWLPAEPTDVPEPLHINR